MTSPFIPEKLNVTRMITLFWLGLTLTAQAETVQVAVASNFAGAMQRIVPAFRRATGHEATVIAAGTGKLYAQITHGAPFEVLLSADEKTPKRLEEAGLAVPGTRFTYALGRLVLWSARSDLVDPEGRIIREGRFVHLALGNPATVPYGQAAVEVLQHLGLYEALEPKFVRGENIAQTQQFVASGNAELGFVAQSGVYSNGQLIGGSAWRVPAYLHAPIRQEAILLKRGRENGAARALLHYLRSLAARDIMASLGYGQE